MKVWTVWTRGGGYPPGFTEDQAREQATWLAWHRPGREFWAGPLGDLD